MAWFKKRRQFNTYFKRSVAILHLTFRQNVKVLNLCHHSLLPFLAKSLKSLFIKPVRFCPRIQVFKYQIMANYD